MAEICLQCGDIGDKKKLIYCFRCTQSARHRYCMDVMPKKHETIRWLCDDCDESINKSPGEVDNNNPGITNPGITTTTTSTTTDDRNFSYSFYGITNPGLYQQQQQPVEPLIRSVWTGTFDVTIKEGGPSVVMLRDVHAFLSSRACMQVRGAVGLFRPVIGLEMGPRMGVWPKSFAEGMGPTEDNIGVYFFSLLAEQVGYDRLVFEMVRDDLAMRADVGDGVELLVFPSTELPYRVWRFQGKLYLWGVFRGKQPN